MIPVRARLISIAAMIIAAMLIASLALPAQAQALEVERWSAKSNQDGDRGVMGATSTRVTWQGQTAEEESLQEVVINLPEGSTVEAANVTVTVLAGLERLEVPSEVSAEGTAVTVSFPEPTPPGSLIMVEFNRTMFPAEGGAFGVTGSYTTADGQTHDIPETDKTIEVIGTTPAEQLSSWLGEQAWVQAWNSNTFLHLFFDPAIIVTSIPALFWGWLTALGLVVISFPLAIPFGLVWSFLRMAKSRLLRALGATYINIVRGTPLFLQIYIAFFGLPLLGVKIDSLVLGAIVLVMNSSAYLAEIFRAGIQSISKGQSEAARSLGMNGMQTMFHVIIPQTIRRVIPTMTSEFILMYKDTSLLAAVGVMDLMMYAKTITAATGNVTPYIVAAGFYLIVTIPLTKCINMMEGRLGGKHRRRSKGIGSDSTPPPTDSEAVAVQNIRLSETFAGSRATLDARMSR